MKTVAMRLDDATVEILEAKAKEQDITVSEYLREQIFPLMEGMKPLSLEQCLAKLDRSLALLKLCLKPLHDLLFELEKFETELIVKQEMEKKPDEPSQIEPETATTPS